MDETSAPREPIDFVLLIDADNDPHVPPDVHPTLHTLVRVFLRPGAKMPRTLEKKLGPLPHCATVVSPRGGANAADFVMALHAGMLHAILPQHIHFRMVTNDATLQAMAAELQRLGRIATIWTSHAAASTTSAAPEEPREGASGRRRSRRSERSRGGRLPRRAEAAAAANATLPSDEPRKPGGKTLSEVAWAYAARLQRIKDAPSRLKTLLNDIKNRTGSHGFSPEEILEELKRYHDVKVDPQGHVVIARIKPADATGQSPADASKVSPS